MFSITFFIQVQHCQIKWILRIEFQCLDSAHEAESDSVGGSKGQSHFAIFDDSGLFWEKMNKPVQKKMHVNLWKAQMTILLAQRKILEKTFTSIDIILHTYS